MERLTQRRLNRSLLARQLLLERTSLPLERVLEQVAGLQTQYAPSGYIGLWSRVRDFTRPMLTDALRERRVLQGTLMRATIHLVSAADYWPMAHAVRRVRRAWWLRTAGDQVAGTDIGGLTRAIRDAVGEGPLRQRVLDDRLRAAGYPSGMAGANVLVDLLRVPPSGTWERRRADLYALAEAWLPEPPFDESADVDHLVRRYLGGFGPAAPPDIAQFGGIELSAVHDALSRLDHRAFGDLDGRQLVDLPDGPLPDEETRAPVRFIGTWEAMLLVHARRTQVLPEAYRSRIFGTKTPHSFNTFLVDGQVAGTWRYDQGAVRWESFGRLAAADRREVDEEAARLTAFHAG